MKIIRPFSTALLALGIVVAPPSVRALTDAEAKTGRELVNHTADSIVGVELVVTVKMTMGDRAMPPRENKIDINGTVLDANGLTVTSLAAIDPRTQFEAMRGAMGANAARMEISETDYKEVKLRLADGTEVPARVVLKDADLDLAFIAPEAGEAGGAHAFSPVKLEDAAEGELLASYFVVSRAAKALRRVPVIRPTLVVGIVEKPRRLFLLSDQQIGCPVFDSTGRVLGVSVQNLSGGRPSGLVVLPAGDVAEIARQAAAEAAKPVAKKPATEEPKKEAEVAPAAAPEAKSP